MVEQDSVQDACARLSCDDLSLIAAPLRTRDLKCFRLVCKNWRVAIQFASNISFCMHYRANTILNPAEATVQLEQLATASTCIEIKTALGSHACSLLRFLKMSLPGLYKRSSVISLIRHVVIMHGGDEFDEELAEQAACKMVTSFCARMPNAVLALDMLSCISEGSLVHCRTLKEKMASTHRLFEMAKLMPLPELHIACAILCSDYEKRGEPQVQGNAVKPRLSSCVRDELEKETARWVQVVEAVVQRATVDDGNLVSFKA
mmetsp:Transcript_31008/g.81092  ORF Transcript_31008/g.81092 Transcript_31008/m.81092 type:complete len:261 (+) Transcript_31008:90-872(+)